MEQLRAGVTHALGELASTSFSVTSGHCRDAPGERFVTSCPQVKALVLLRSPLRLGQVMSLGYISDNCFVEADFARMMSLF